MQTTRNCREPFRNRFSEWMVQRNLEYVETEGVEVVVARLRAQGYNQVADRVECLAN